MFNYCRFLFLQNIILTIKLQQYVLHEVLYYIVLTSSTIRLLNTVLINASRTFTSVYFNRSILYLSIIQLYASYIVNGYTLIFV